MPRHPKPWLRRGRGWYVTLHGRQYSLGKNKKAAQKLFHELMANPPEPMTVSAQLTLEVLDLFLDWTQKHRAPRTYRWYHERLQSFAPTVSADLTADRLRPHHIIEWLDQHPNWSDTTVRSSIVAVQRAFRWAEKMGYIATSPVQHLEKPAAGRRDEVISAAEFQTLLTHVRDQQFTDLLTISWEVGCRPQESLRVEARHVDVKNARWVLPPKEAKGKKRPRIVYMTDTAMAVTSRCMLKWPDGPILRNTCGRPWNPWAVNCRFQRLKEKTGRKLCLYLFRHSFATRMLEAGVDALTVAILLGHANTAMLSTTYQHLNFNPGHLRNELRRVSA